MRDELLGYYERELSFLRQMGADFAQKYPKIAARLLLEADKCEDPHVERMIEAFAFLAGRVHLKIDDEFPEVTESLLNVLYPHYLAPVPSMSVVQFALDPDQGKLTTGYEMPRHTTLYSRAVAGTPCRFRTNYPVTVWPLEVAAADLVSLDPVDTRGKWSEAALKLTVHCLNNTRLSELKTGESDPSKARPIDSLRFFLNGEPQLVYPLYEMIFNHATRVELRAVSNTPTSMRVRTAGSSDRAASSATIVLPASSIKAVGFEADEGMLPYTARSFPGYRLLTEYFTFPDKFLFFDIAGLGEAARKGFGSALEISIHLRDIVPPRAVLSADTFALGCTPIINLFNKIAEPVQLTAQQHEYHIIPDVHRQTATEVYAVESVRTTDPQFQASREFQPFYSYRHVAGGNGAAATGDDRAFWYATRRPSQREEDAGTEVYLSLVDLGFNPHVPAVETVTIHTLCTNRDLPGKLPFGGGREGDFEVEGTAPLARIQCLKKPTPTVRPPLKRAAHWRLISHLSLNHLSLLGNATDGSPESLQEILLLYDFYNSSATRKQITGITNVQARRVVRQTGSRIGAGFVRGLETTVEFNEENYVGSGVFLFASVLERFLGLYASVNSFNQMVAQSAQREGIIKRWLPRAGEQTLL